MYPKKYESYFYRTKRTNKCKIENVSTDIDLSAGEYIDLFRKAMIDFENTLFEKYVRIDWLRHRFCYCGKRRIKNRYNGFVDYSFGVFMNNFVGFDVKLYNKNLFFFISSYFPDFFPDFYKRDPFKEKFVYPYKYMRFPHLALVHQMDDRLELLAYGEKKGMKYSEFGDFIINHVSCYNEEMGGEVYRILPNRHNGGMLVIKMIGKKPYHAMTGYEPPK